MNPSYLFSLSESKRALYRNQPDLAQGLQISEPEEYEHPPFVKTRLFVCGTMNSLIAI